MNKKSDSYLTEDLVRQMPKTDLHLHLDGSLRIGTILDIAEKQKVKLPTYDPDKLFELVSMESNCKSLEDYLKAFEITVSVLQDADSLTRVAYELAEDCAKENCRYIEVRYSPILHIKKGLRLTTIIDSVLEGLGTAEKDFGIRSGIIICGMRNIDPENSILLAELAVAYKDRGVIGFDLAGAEEHYPAKRHKEAFFLIQNNNINSTAHAGEGYGPESIAQAIHYCGAHRIGHGVRLKEDNDLMNYVNDHRIPLEICMSSNMHTGSVPKIESHPLRFYYDFGLRVTINTDNRLMSNTTVTKELYLAVKYLNFTLQEIKDLIVFGFKSSFLPYRDKVKMLHQAIDELKQFVDPKTKVAKIADKI